MNTYDAQPGPNGKKTTLTDGIPQELDSARNDIKAIKADTLELAGHLKEGTVKIAKTAAGAAQDKIDEVVTMTEEKADSLEQEIRAKPLQSVAVAFACGIVLSMFLSRR
jgi:ElaB/YqjD/DUF883 family membrane-anchored ribosome-binding protein